MRGRRIAAALAAVAAVVGGGGAEAGATSGGRFVDVSAELVDAEHLDRSDDLAVYFTETGIGSADATVTVAATRTRTAACVVPGVSVVVRREEQVLVDLALAGSDLAGAESRDTDSGDDAPTDTTTMTDNGRASGQAVLTAGPDADTVCSNLDEQVGNLLRESGAPDRLVNLFGRDLVSAREREGVEYRDVRIEDTANGAFAALPGPYVYQGTAEASLVVSVGELGTVPPELRWLQDRLEEVVCGKQPLCQVVVEQLPS